MNRSLIIRFSVILLAILSGNNALAQIGVTKVQSNQETIPGNMAPEIVWWNVLHYAIDLTPDYKTRSIKGNNRIEFRTLQSGKVMQIDLQQPMVITKIVWLNKQLLFLRKGNAYYVNFPRTLNKNQTETLTVYFEGTPAIAKNPPFDNGWIWKEDKKGRPWISVACEGSGASIWLPCKDVLYDEPDNGISFRITIPDTLVAIANGRLIKKIDNPNRTTTYHWTVVNTINNYNIIPYIGKYVTWHHEYSGRKGKLDCDFWVLDYHLQKAKNHFQQVDTMLQCFEYWLGPYPFYEDSYKLVEAPMPGMEHQSAIAYGNEFENGYAGKNLSGTIWGLQWDFILVHESGHEWFGNSITAGNDGDSWIHEGFTKYLETLYTAYVFGNEAGNDYAIGTWKRIKNDAPILGTNTTDKYYKGSAMLHMIRQITGDSLFRGFLTGLNKAFYHCTVTTNQILEFLNLYTKMNFTKIFDQYLQTIKIPRLDYLFKGNTFMYRWSNCVDGFSMPISISLDGLKFQFVTPTNQWQSLPFLSAKRNDFRIDRNFYITTHEVNTSLNDR